MKLLPILIFLIIGLNFKIIRIETHPRWLGWYFNYPSNPLYMNNTFIGTPLINGLDENTKEIMDWKLGYPYFDIYPLMAWNWYSLDNQLLPMDP